MRTGLKTLVGKVVNQIYYPTLLYKNINTNIFPEKKTKFFIFKARLFSLHSYLRSSKVAYNLGSLFTLPHSIAVGAYKGFLKYNPGNLGIWSDDVSQTWATTTFEYEVIHKMINLYHGDHKNMSGYITSGGTEGNIFAVWLARLYLEKKYKKKKNCLFVTSLTHYSIKKAGNICGVSQYLLPLHKKNWNIDKKGFVSGVKSQYKKGYRGFIVPLTLGYTSTGTKDDITSIINAAKKLKKELKNCEFFFWIDAAFNGLITPFLDKNFKPFLNPEVNAIVVDFHKFGLVPYSAGIILFKKNLKELIEKPIDYLSENDATLLGSRSGVPAVSIWSMIHAFGKEGYSNLVREQMENKIFLIEQLKNINLKIKVLTDPLSLTCGLIFNGLPNCKLPKNIEEKYSLHPGKTSLLFYPNKKKEEIIYKLFLLPHMKKKVIEEFINDLQFSLKNNQ